MILTIVRHGKAQQGSPTGLDEDRALRPRGERQAHELGERFAQDWTPDRIIASRFVRARHTAEIIAEALDAPLDFAPELECERPVSDAVELIQRSADTPALMLVGHNMQLQMLIWTLIGSDEFGHLYTGEAAVLRVEDPELASPFGAAEHLERVRLDD